MQKDIITFLEAGLNWDAALSKMPKGDSRNILNTLLYASESGNVGDAENIKGNTIETYTGYPTSDTNSVIGACVDRENEAIIAFMYNPDGKDTIVRYYPVTDAFEIILQEDKPNAGVWTEYLNFNTARYMNIDARVVGDNLIWVNGVSIRQVNITKAINFSAGTGTPIYGGMTEQILDFIKHPPIFQPIVIYETDTTVNTNNLRGKLFQFCYRYVNDDYIKSATSVFSEIPLPEGGEMFDGEIIMDLDKNNRIKITVNTGNEEVSDIEIYVREGNIGVWYFAGEVNKEELSLSDDADYDFYFYNDRMVEVATQSEISEPFDYVPQSAVTLEVLENNRVIFGEITEDFPEVDVAVDLSVVEEELAFESKGVLQHDYVDAAQLDDSGTPGVDYRWDWVTDVKALVAGWILELTIDDIVHSYSITAAMVADKSITYRDFIIEKINSSDYYSNIKASVVAPANLKIIEDDNGAFSMGAKLYSSAIPTEQIKYTGFKRGAPHPFGIVYYDRAKRSSGVNKNSDCLVYVKFPPETAQTDHQYRACIDWKIGHIPPEWATHWQWVYATNSYVLDFVEYVVDEVERDTVTNKLKIRLEALNTLKDYDTETDTRQLDSIIDPYVYKKGDRIRFITEEPPHDGNQILGIVLPFYLDLEILGVDEDALGKHWILCQDPGADYISATGGDHKIFDLSLAEIYTPKKALAEDIYYKYGSVYEIGSPGTASRIHIATGQSQGVNQDIESSTPDTPVVISITGHNYENGDNVYVADHLVNTDANGFWTVANKTADTFELSGSVGNGTGSATGTVCKVAMGQFTHGDIYHILRVFNADIDTGADGTQHPILIESQNYSDFYISDVYDLGRPIVEIDDVRQSNISTILRYGGIYLKNTKINNLAKFDYDNYSTKLSPRDGKIYKLQTSGDVLKVFQAHKKTSIYIGKKVLYQADGTQELVTTDAVLGTFQPAIEDYGTIFPGSVVSHSTHTYFYDIYKGEVVRDAYNGMFSISDYRMKRYFSAKSKALLASLAIGSDRVRVEAVFDEKYGLYIITFIDYETSTNKETIAFHEASNRWILFFSHVPADRYISYGEYLVSFNNGVLYTHYTNATRNNFYGVQYKQQYSIVSHGGAEDNKIFKIIDVYSNKKWCAPATGDITIPVTETYTRGMSSRLKASHFVAEEGVFSADFLRNELTTSATASRNDLSNGELLRGSVIQIDLENSETVEVVLKRIDIGFDVSL